MVLDIERYAIEMVSKLHYLFLYESAAFFQILAKQGCQICCHLADGLRHVVSCLLAELPAEDVSLLVWMEDSGKELPKTLTRQKFDAALKTWGEMGVGPIRAVFIENGHANTLEQGVKTAVLPTDKVTNLIISTHGSTKVRKNRVRLEELGEFGVDGSNGQLRKLFELLASHFSHDLNISFQACSTSWAAPRFWWKIGERDQSPRLV